MQDLTEMRETREQTGEIQIAKSRAEVAAEIQGAIVSAKQFPRSEERARTKILDTCKNPKLAEIARYQYKRGGTVISGPSVNLAREVGRIWGNLRYGLNIISDDDDKLTIEGWAWDVETNSKVTAQDTFKKLIYRKKGGWIKPDERDLRELINRRGAIAVRNCILQLIPRYIVDEAQEICRETLAGSIKDPKTSMRKLVDAFNKIGVTIDMIEDLLGHSIEIITSEEIADLRPIYQSIIDGNSSRDEYFDISKSIKDEGENGKSKPTSDDNSISPDDMKPEEDVETEPGIDPKTGEVIDVPVDKKKGNKPQNGLNF